LRPDQGLQSMEYQGSESVRKLQRSLKSCLKIVQHYFFGIFN
jgi:hypothetical protein